MEVALVSLSGSAFAMTHDCASVPAGGSCSVSLAFTPALEGPTAGTLTVVTSLGSASIAITGSGERSLVAHYYASILGRSPDAAGRLFWANEAARVQGLGADINETWFAMAQGFFGSAEYLAFGRTPADFMRDLYRTFFNRTADDAGLAYWLAQMSAGMPREVVLASFMFSPEFGAFTKALFGDTAARAEVATVMDFYRGLLGRLPDSGGFGYWVGRFRAAQCAGAAAVHAEAEAISGAFLNSAEYGARNRGDGQFVGDMYNAFLRRGGDLPGVNFWVGQVASGAMSRDAVRRSFMTTPEFSARVAAIVAAGCTPH
jgi:hypothetical protein